MSRGNSLLGAGRHAGGMACGNAVPESIVVDGVERPTRDSTGRPLGRDEAELRNFWRWFKMRRAALAGQPIVRADFTPEAAEALASDLRKRLEQLGIADRAALKIVENIRGLPLEVAHGLASTRPEDVGNMMALIEIALGATDPTKTLNHEAIHVMRSLGLFRNAEWRVLEAAARANTTKMNELRPRYEAMGFSEDVIIEEVIAEMYADWAAGRAKPTGFLRRAFERIRDFFHALIGALNSRGYTSANDIFEAIERGEIGRRRARDERGRSVSPQDVRYAAYTNFDQPADYTFNEADYRQTVVQWAKDRWGDKVAPNGRPIWQNFVRWFGDSKVVDEQGRPLVVYHGVKDADMRVENGAVVFTPKFDVFDTKGRTEPGAWFSPDPKVAAKYGTPIPFYLKAVAPAREEGPLTAAPENADAVYRMRGKGDSIAQAWEIAVFRPGQIKLATGNRGTFDGSNPDISFSLSPEQREREGVALSVAALPDTITVDGKQRPTRNSNGQPLGRTEEEVRNFWRWFGSSRVVDDQGRPLVVYHGTRTKGEAIDAFDIEKAGSKTDSGWMGKGFYFGGQRTADAYAGHYEFDPSHYPEGGAVYPVYLSIQNPAILKDSERNDGPRTMVRELLDLADDASASEVRDGLLAAGYDGVIYERFSPYGNGYREYVAFHPEQIKSAIGNRGTFDGSNPDIRFSLFPEQREREGVALSVAALPDTITVGGKQRPTRNSNGQPLGRTEEEVRNFWRWFGSSRVVDDQGRPLVVYHGTKGDFAEFQLGRADRRDGGWFGDGFYLTASQDLASSYAMRERDYSLTDRPANVMPVYVRMSNPYRINLGELSYDEGSNFTKKYGGNEGFRKWLADNGYDGVIGYRDPEIAGQGAEFWEVVVFDPAQIKSAIGNRGTFDGSNPDIRFSLSPEQREREGIALSVDGLPETIEVDGVERPTRNSNGQPIAATEEGIRNFWRWFGDSKVVDENGEPVVVYHGTRHDISAFSREKSLSFGRFYFARDPKVAADYSGFASGANVIPVYLSLQNPLVVEARGALWIHIPLDGVPSEAIDLLAPSDISRGATGTAALSVVAEALGRDGLIVRNVIDSAGPYSDEHPTDVYIAFRPEQIKSAIGNDGTFDPANPDIRYLVAYHGSPYRFSLAAAVNEQIRQARELFDLQKSAGAPNFKLDKADLAEIRFRMSLQPVATEGVLSAVREEFGRLPFVNSAQHEQNRHTDLLDATIAALKRFAADNVRTAPVHILPSAAMAPLELRAAMKLEKCTYQGAFYGGAVWVFLDGCSSLREVKKTILHEGAHLGLRALFGDSLNETLLWIYDSNAEVRRRADAYIAGEKRQGFRCTIPEAVDEVLATMAEDIEPSIIERLGTAICAVVRRWWPELELFDFEVRQVVRNALSRKGQSAEFSHLRWRKVWRGTPQDDVEHLPIGKMESQDGGLAFGWGRYFRDANDVAAFCRRDTAFDSQDSAQPHAGVSEAQINDDEYLLWDTPLIEQPEYVQSILRGIYPSFFERGRRETEMPKEKMTGGELYISIAESIGGCNGRTHHSQRLTSELLWEAGIKGIRYLDEEEQRIGEDPYNYVVFGDGHVSAQKAGRAFVEETNYLIGSMRP